MTELFADSSDSRSNVIHITRQQPAPPSSQAMEEAVIGGILFDPNALERIADFLKPEHFYVSFNAEIYKAALSLHQENQAVDLFTTSNWLQERNLLDKVGGQSRLIELYEVCMTAANIDAYAHAIRKKWMRRRTASICHQIASLAYDETINDDLLQNEAERLLMGVFEQGRNQDFAELGALVMDEYESISLLQAGGKPPGIPTGFHDLDDMTQGLQRQDLIVVAGRPSMGKTAWVLNAMNSVGGLGLPTVIFSLEMSKNQIAQRFMSMESSVNSGFLRTGNVSDRDWDALGVGVSKLVGRPIYIDDTPVVSVATIRSKSRKLMAQVGQLGLIAVDYLQLMEGASDNRVQEIAKITRSLKALARELNVPIVALSQLSRGVESRSDKRPMMSDLRESGAIEQDADLVCMLYRDEYYNPESDDRGIAEVIITKQRNGPTGTVKLLFEPQFNRFKSLATGYSGHQESYPPPQPTTPRKPPSTPPKAPNQPKKEPAKREPQPVANEPSNHPFDDAVAESIPPMPDEVDGFRKGDRVEITLANFPPEMQKQIRREDGFVEGRAGVVMGFEQSSVVSSEYKPVIAIDGAETKSFPTVYLRKIDDTDCDDF